MIIRAMIALLQRVNHASVEIDEQPIAAITKGLLIFIGVEKSDTENNADKLFNKIRRFRTFTDKAGKMNLTIEQVAGEILLVPQFTLPATTDKGNRPGFDAVAIPELGERLFNYLVAQFRKNTPLQVQTGQFQAHMNINLQNDGPITFWLKK